MSWKNALKKLEALPKEDRRLLSEIYYDAEKSACCAIGILLPKTVAAKLENEGNLPIGEMWTPKLSKQLGLSLEEAEHLQMFNDDYTCQYPSNSVKDQRKRFTYILKFVREKVNETQVP